MKKSRIQMLKVKGVLAFGLITTLILTLVPTENVGAKSYVEQPEQVMEIQAKALDKRAIVLKEYLADRNSPLENHAQDFIDAADYYGVDWKLVPAISGVESTFGKHTPGSFESQSVSYNGWGWGVYGTQALYFKSWRHGIFTVTAGLKKDYIGRGLTDPYSMNKRYASSPTWGSKVDYFMKDIDKFYNSKSEFAVVDIDQSILSLKEAGDSASLNKVI